MQFATVRVFVFGALGLVLAALAPESPMAAAGQGSSETLNLAERLKAGRVRGVGRQVTASAARGDAIHLSEADGEGVAWVEGTDFGEGTLDVEIRGRDVTGRSFVGIAFHRKDDRSYEAVYLRPFNFRAQDAARRDHAVQYMMVPDYDWPRLRKEFPEEFENPVDKSLDPTGWVPVRVVVKGRVVQIFAGGVKSPTLEVRKLGDLTRGQVGLWVGNGSDGDFANLRITPAR
jgi:hypothetical protein